MNTLTYSPREVTIIIAGAYEVTGYAEGEFVTIQKEVQATQTQRAMDGSVARLYTKDDGYRMTLTLAQSSPTNDFLGAVYNLDAATRKGKFPLVVKDTLGNTNFFAGTAWIETPPTVGFGGTLRENVWRFACYDATLRIGGNSDLTDFENYLSQGAAILPILRQYGLI